MTTSYVSKISLGIKSSPKENYLELRGKKKGFAFGSLHHHQTVLIMNVRGTFYLAPKILLS